jgi:hypothetical protein
MLSASLTAVVRSWATVCGTLTIPRICPVSEKQFVHPSPLLELAGVAPALQLRCRCSRERVSPPDVTAEELCVGDRIPGLCGADEKLTAFLELGSNDLDPLLGSDIRINFLGDLFLKNQGLSPIGNRTASITILRFKP